MTTKAQKLKSKMMVTSTQASQLLAQIAKLNQHEKHLPAECCKPLEQAMAQLATEIDKSGMGEFMLVDVKQLKTKMADWTLHEKLDKFTDCSDAHKKAETEYTCLLLMHRAKVDAKSQSADASSAKSSK